MKVKQQVSLPTQDDCKGRKNTKYWITKQGPNTETPQAMDATMNQQQQNHHLSTDSNLSLFFGGGA